MQGDAFQRSPLPFGYNCGEVAAQPAHVTGIYPGSFDPITNGHLDIIERSSHVVDHLIVAVLRNEQKHPLFSVAERADMVREAVAGRFGNVEVDTFDGLLVDYAASRGATLIVRGIRAISDYEYELQMAHMNRRLKPEIETVFLMAGEQFSFLSSRLVKEVIRLGGNVTGLVPETVERRLRERLAPVAR
jgi:pantetheine-phosphate adenylyltransferase